MERDTSEARILELDFTAATCDEKLGVVLRAVRSLKGRVAAGEDRSNSAEDRACNMFGRMFELPAIVKELNWTVNGECARVAGLVNAKLVRIQSDFSGGLSESERRISEAIWDE